MRSVPGPWLPTAHTHPSCHISPWLSFWKAYLDTYEERVGHLGRQPLQLDRAFVLKVPNSIIVSPILGLQRRPCHEDMLQHPEHNSRLRIECPSGKGHKKLENPLANQRILGECLVLDLTSNTSQRASYLKLHFQKLSAPVLKELLDSCGLCLLHPRQKPSSTADP